MKRAFEFKKLKSFSPYSMEKKEKQVVDSVITTKRNKVCVTYSEPIAEITLDPVQAQKYATALLMQCGEAIEEMLKDRSENRL